MVTTFSAIFLSVVTLISGWIIGTYFGKNKGNWEAKYNAIEAERSELMNEVKREKKSNSRLSQQKDTAVEKLEAVEKKFNPMMEKSTAEIKALNERITEMDNERHKLKTELDKKTARVEQLEKEYEKLKERYDTDLSDSKGWKNKRDTLERELKEFRAKYERTHKEADELRSRLSNQSKSIKEAQKFQADFRKLRAANKKLTNDIEYWEKKHYDTHHELAEAIKKIEGMTAQHTELDLLMKGQDVKEQNMMKKLEEFKTKFVNANNQYHELLNQTKQAR